MQNNPCGTADNSEVTMDTGGTSAEGADNGGWQGPVMGRGAARPNKPDFPRLKITNSFQPLLERATDNTEAVPSQETSRTTRPTQVENTTRPKPPPPIVIHGFVENFDDLKRLLQQQVGRNYTVKFTRRNTTKYDDLPEKQTRLDQSQGRPQSQRYGLSHFHSQRRKNARFCAEGTMPRTHRRRCPGRSPGRKGSYGAKSLPNEGSEKTMLPSGHRQDGDLE
jgi:hypothetical protein